MTLASSAKDHFRRGEWEEAYVAARKADQSDPEILYILGRTLEDNKTYNALMKRCAKAEIESDDFYIYSGGLMGFWQDSFAGCGIYVAVKYYVAALKSGNRAIIKKINRRKAAYNLKLLIFPLVLPFFCLFDKEKRQLLLLPVGLAILSCIWLKNPFVALAVCSAIWLIPGLLFTLLLLWAGHSWDGLCQEKWKEE